MACLSCFSCPGSGYQRLTIDISAQDRVRFKAICALNGNTMGHEINAR
jgi:hypothetical protein